MRWVYYGALGLGLFVGGVVITGLLLPARHVATRSVAVPARPDPVWALITDFERNPAWRKDLRRVTRVPDQGGREVWREESADGEVIPYETVEREESRRLVRRIADPDLPFGGTWTIDVEPEGDGSRVRITEHGEVRNPIFRFVSTVLIGHTSYMDAYLSALARHFGGDGTPE